MSEKDKMQADGACKDHGRCRSLLKEVALPPRDSASTMIFASSVACIHLSFSLILFPRSFVVRSFPPCHNQSGKGGVVNMWVYDSPIGPLVHRPHKMMVNTDFCAGSAIIWEACPTPQIEADNVYCRATGCAGDFRSGRASSRLVRVDIRSQIIFPRPVEHFLCIVRAHFVFAEQPHDDQPRHFLGRPFPCLPRSTSAMRGSYNVGVRFQKRFAVQHDLHHLHNEVALQLRRSVQFFYNVFRFQCHVCFVSFC